MYFALFVRAVIAAVGYLFTTVLISLALGVPLGV
jgi:hypothetical protein